MNHRDPWSRDNFHFRDKDPWHDTDFSDDNLRPWNYLLVVGKVLLVIVAFCVVVMATTITIAQVM